MINGVSFAQNYRGIWISSHVRVTTIVKERSLFALHEDDIKTIKLDSVEIDTFYYDAFVILDFINEEDIAVKTILGSKEMGFQQMGTFSIKKGKLKIKIDKENLKGSASENQIVLINKLKNSTTRETFFKRINPSELKITEILNSTSLFNTNWIVETDTTSLSYGYNFHLLDSNIVIITQEFGEYGYTNWGKFAVDSYKNHLFLIFVNEQHMNYNVYHIYDRDKDTLIGNTFEHYIFATEPPPLNIIKLSKNKLLDKAQLSLIESKLIGRWIAINNPIPLNEFSGFDTIINQKFVIEFMVDNTFELIKAGTLVNRMVETQKEIVLSGVWEVSETGKYIVLKPIDSWIKYLTLLNLTEDYLEIYYEIESFDGGLISINNGIIKMKK
jgi:hypothetical protein